MSPLVGCPGPGDFCPGVILSGRGVFCEGGGCPGGLFPGGTFSPGVFCPGALLAWGLYPFPLAQCVFAPSSLSVPSIVA